ncbi:hypothetical protein TWF718_006286 [Orbilia javanica]|uniref:Fungal N-terminal domain-containing protein n=1 Tax=Orbilia javanica TaxID=47235 RepID=A0AAN8N391_9PEZI
MDHISSGVGSGLLLPVGVPIGLAITRISSLLKKFGSASSTLDDLNKDLKEIERQVQSLNEFLKLAEFAPERHHQCERLIHGLYLEANKLTNLLDCMEMKLAHKSFFSRSKHRLSLVDSNFEGVRRQIDRINGTITTIRQEMILATIVDFRNENRVQNQQVREDIQRVNRNLTGNDAKQIRKIYGAVAMELMYLSNFVDYSALGLNTGPAKEPAIPARVPQVRSQSAVSRLQIDFNILGPTDLGEVTEAFSKILGGSTFDKPGFRRRSQARELAA